MRKATCALCGERSPTSPPEPHSSQRCVGIGVYTYECVHTGLRVLAPPAGSGGKAAASKKRKPAGGGTKRKRASKQQQACIRARVA